jgi:pseudouridine-5'-phosphate glycosidase
MKLPSFYQLSPEVVRARQMNLPIVALETAVVTHGLPAPENVAVAVDMADEVRSQGAVPATIGMLEGKILVGVNRDQLERIATARGKLKISRRDFSSAISKRESGGTTVAATLIAAETTGIRVFATGGIGGVHRNAPFDISADLPTLARTPVVVVCAGAKAILDLPATLEYLETAGIPLVGYQTDEFPGFYARSSGLPVSTRVDSPEGVAEIARTHWGLGLNSSILIVVPPPESAALSNPKMEDAIQQALRLAQDHKVTGKEVTPFLLDKVSQLTGGASLRANLALLINNARIAAQIARTLHEAG